MASKILNTRIQLKYDTEANWTSKNPVLLSGEMAVSSDKNGQFKIGNGTATWSQLSYNQVPWTSVTGRPSSMKNPSALTVQFNGVTNKIYDGNSAETVNITPGAIGAATSSHTHAFDKLQLNSNIKAKNAITANKIIVGTTEGFFHLASNTSFNINYPILYSTTAISAGTVSSSVYFSYPGISVKTLFSFDATAYSIVYIKGILNGTTFTTVSGNILTCIPPTKYDGYTYISLGYATSATSIYLFSNHSMYQFVHGLFQEITGSSLLALEDIDCGYLNTLDSDIINTFDCGPL